MPLGTRFGASWGLFWASWGPLLGPLGGLLGPLGGLLALPGGLLGRKALNVAYDVFAYACLSTDKQPFGIWALQFFIIPAVEFWLEVCCVGLLCMGFLTCETQGTVR